MSSADSKNVTELLLAWGRGEQQALNQLLPLVYAHLHRLAHHYMRQERPGHMLQSTALVHEAYERLIDSKNVQWQNRAHFFAVAAQLMRRILVDFARAQKYLKRGGQMHRLSLDEGLVLAQERSVDLVALDDA